jgi:hypothetical protein
MNWCESCCRLECLYSRERWLHVPHVGPEVILSHVNCVAQESSCRLVEWRGCSCTDSMKWIYCHFALRIMWEGGEGGMMITYRVILYWLIGRVAATHHHIATIKHFSITTTIEAAGSRSSIWMTVWAPCEYLFTRGNWEEIGIGLGRHWSRPAWAVPPSISNYKCNNEAFWSLYIFRYGTKRNCAYCILSLRVHLRRLGPFTKSLSSFAIVVKAVTAGDLGRRWKEKFLPLHIILPLFRNPSG